MHEESSKPRETSADPAAHLETLLNHTTDFILVCDERGSPVLFNEAYREIMRAAGIEMAVGLRPHTLLPDPEQVAWWESLHQRALGGEAFRVEYAHQLGERERHFEIVFNPIRRDGAIVGFTEISRDITERKQAEAKNAALLAQLHHAQKMEAVGNLAGGIAHDMNNVLLTIAGVASVLEDDLEEDNPLHRDLTSILEACERAHDLTRNLLGFARRGKFHTERISLADAVLEACAILERTPAEHLVVRKELDANLCPIDADAAQITHAIVNLGLNAAYATRGEGTLTFDATNVELSEGDVATRPELVPGPYVRLRVEDTGVGMAPDVMARAFEPFFTTKPQGEGTGLGLAMVYGTVRNHGGRVELASTPGKGTSVIIFLPVAKARTGPAQRVVAQEASAAGGVVMLVDDEPLVRDAGRRMFEKLGYSVLLAEGGAAALRLQREHRGQIALVILDLMMPEMDGAQTYRALADVDPDLPVIISSGYIQDERVDELVAAGAVGFLQKPFRLKTLASQLSALLGV